MSKIKTQIGTSLTGDFGEGTWTFEMLGKFEIAAGDFAIIPNEKYVKLLAALKGIRNSMAIHPDCNTDSEFECMVSRCDEILNEI